MKEEDLIAGILYSFEYTYHQQKCNKIYSETMKGYYLMALDVKIKNEFVTYYLFVRKDLNNENYSIYYVLINQIMLINNLIDDNNETIITYYEISLLHTFVNCANFDYIDYTGMNNKNINMLLLNHYKKQLTPRGNIAFFNRTIFI